MGWTGDPVWLADVLRAEGVKVVETPGWKDWGNGDFKNIWGVICHHTGGSNTPVSEIRNGTPNLRGLLSQIHLAKDGTATLCGVGVAWHAGMGSYPGLPEDNANWHTIGIEAVNNGTEGWSPAQYDAYVRVCAAIVRRLGYGADRVIGHKEWAGRKQGKWDPGGIDMDAFRRDVQARLSAKGDAPMSAAEVADIKDFITKFVGPIGSDVKDIREQLCGEGQRNAGQYKGWKQLGGKTLVDAVADLLKGGK